MAKTSETVDLFMIENVDRDQRKIFLGNYIFDKKRVYQGTEEEIEYFADIFYEALERNIFLSVAFDDEKGIIMQ